MVRGAQFEIIPDVMTYGGEVMGRLPDGRAVFVMGALPGERIRIAITEDRARFARAALLEVLQPSPDRVASLSDTSACGGCNYQHIAYPAQLRYKTAIVRDQFARIAGLPDAPVADILPSPEQWNYRNTAQFHLAPDGRLGFQQHGTHAVVPITDCPLCVPALNELLPLLDFTAASEELLADESLRIVLRAGAEDDAMLIFESKLPTPPELEIALPISVAHIFVDPAGVSHSVVLAGDDHVVMQAAGRAFRVSPGSFFQVNLPQAERMVAFLQSRLAMDSDQSGLEVYAGVGLFSAAFAPRVKDWVAIESSLSAVDDFAANLDEFDNVSIYSGLAEDVLPGLEITPDVCVVDPPRAGLALPALDALIRMSPQTLAYISCDPSTLARDVKRLSAAGYRLIEAQPFDMFPQTHHVECVALMSHEKH